MELFHRKAIQEKHQQRLCNSAETHFNSSSEESNYFSFQLYRFDKLVIKVVFLLYLGFIWVFSPALVSILALFVPYLSKFCICCSETFATAPSLGSLCFFVSLLIILNMFCMPFYYYHHWQEKINAPGTVHSSTLNHYH